MIAGLSTAPKPKLERQETENFSTGIRDSIRYSESLSIPSFEITFFIYQIKGEIAIAEFSAFFLFAVFFPAFEGTTRKSIASTNCALKAIKIGRER